MGSVRFPGAAGLPRKRITEELYDSLKFSGFVTPYMTYEEMCAVLAEQYPEFDGVWFDGTLGVQPPTGVWEFYKNTTNYPDGYIDSGGHLPYSYDYKYVIEAGCSAKGNRTASGWIRRKDWIYVPSKYKYLNVAWHAWCQGETSTYNKQSHAYVDLFGEDTGTIVHSLVFDYTNYQGYNDGQGTLKVNISGATGQRMRPGVSCDATGSKNVDGSTYYRATFIHASKIWLSET